MDKSTYNSFIVKGAQFFNDYMHVDLRQPKPAKLIFNWVFSGKTPRAELMALDFNIDESDLPS